jgi:hypothetical protein
LSAQRDIEHEQNKRPANAMTNHLQGWHFMQKLPINGEEAPQHIRANPIQNTLVHQFVRHISPLCLESAFGNRTVDTDETDKGLSLRSLPCIQKNRTRISADDADEARI